MNELEKLEEEKGKKVISVTIDVGGVLYEGSALLVFIHYDALLEDDKCELLETFYGTPKDEQKETLLYAQELQLLINERRTKKYPTESNASEVKPPPNSRTLNTLSSNVGNHDNYGPHVGYSYATISGEYDSISPAFTLSDEGKVLLMKEIHKAQLEMFDERRKLKT